MAMRPKKRLHLKMLHSEVQLTELTSGMGQIRLIGWIINTNVGCWHSLVFASLGQKQSNSDRGANLWISHEDVWFLVWLVIIFLYVTVNC